MAKNNTIRGGLVVANPSAVPTGVHVIAVNDRRWFPGDAWDGPEAATDELVASGHLVAFVDGQVSGADAAVEEEVQA